MGRENSSRLMVPTASTSQEKIMEKKTWDEWLKENPGAYIDSERPGLIIVPKNSPQSSERQQERG